MAEIRILPLSVLTAERAARLSGDLADAYRAGADLGSRVPHIRAAADGLVRMRGDLQRELAALTLHLDALGLGSEEGARLARTLLDEVDALAAWALGFGARDEAPGAATGPDAGPAPT